MLYKYWETANGKIAIWKMDEPDQFFVDAIGFSFDIKSEKRRLERLAGRFLLKQVHPQFPVKEIAPDEHDKPRLPDNELLFSISHSWPYVAVMINDTAEAGLDLQCWHSRMLLLQHKFLSEEEQLIFNNDERLITLAWCAKEAVYKWNGRRGIDFIEHMMILEYTGTQMYVLFQKGMVVTVDVFMDDEFAFAAMGNG